MANAKLRTYRAKRDFKRTAEPAGHDAGAAGTGRRYLIQKHDATRMHFDFRLERDGVLLSWAVPNGPSLDPTDKRLAVHVEDHPMEYGDFEGTIPKGEYGGGTVMLWDEGIWEPVGDAEEGYAKGDFKFILHGRRLRGKWVLVRMKPKRGERSRHENWLLIKERDAHAIAETHALAERALTSARSARTMAEIAAGNVEWVEAGYRFREADTKSAGRKRTGTGRKRPEPPKFIAPQLASATETPPAGDAWLHEIKFDGYRLVAAVGGGRSRLHTRTGLDWSEQFAPLRQPLADLPCKSALIDGEAVVTDEAGRTDFAGLREALSAGGQGITYRAFDLLSLDGKDLRATPLIKRKKALQRLLVDQPPAGPIVYSDHVLGNGAEAFAQASAMGLEGIISKRADGRYRSGRTRSWRKAKTELGQEFIIVGWRPSTVKGRPFSSLLVATAGDEGLTYRGRVGSGFGDRELEAVNARLKKLATRKPPLEVPEDIRRSARFVKPELVADIGFAGWTGDGYVRHGVFKALREDKRAADVRLDKPARKTRPAKQAAPAPEPQTPAIVTIDTDRDGD
ncbi:MAG: non-homologous end-joining DNA ligase, partial [Alphaproteobacteria bacterium]